MSSKVKSILSPYEKRTDTVQRFITQNYTAVTHGTELVKAEGEPENFTRVRWADLWISVDADAALPWLIAGIQVAHRGLQAPQMGASSSDVTLKPLSLQAGDAETGPSVAHAAAAGIT